MVISQSINAGFRTAILVFTWFTVVLNASYEVKSCLVKWFNVFMLLSCIFKQFFVPRVDVNRGWTGVQISNVELTLSMVQ